MIGKFRFEKKAFVFQAVLTAAIRLVSLIHNEKRSVLVHCSDGWDRTAQVKMIRENFRSISMIFLVDILSNVNARSSLSNIEWLYDSNRKRMD